MLSRFLTLYREDFTTRVQVTEYVYYSGTAARRRAWRRGKIPVAGLVLAALALRAQVREAPEASRPVLEEKGPGERAQGHPLRAEGEVGAGFFVLKVF